MESRYAASTFETRRRSVLHETSAGSASGCGAGSASSCGSTQSTLRGWQPGRGRTGGGLDARPRLGFVAPSPAVSRDARGVLGRSVEGRARCVSERLLRLRGAAGTGPTSNAPGGRSVIASLPAPPLIPRRDRTGQAHDSRSSDSAAPRRTTHARLALAAGTRFRDSASRT